MSILAALLLTACDRVPVVATRPGLAEYEQPQEPDECSLDVECKVNGCGQYCTAASTDSFVSTCEDPGLPEDAECGCVQTECVWYRP